MKRINNQTINLSIPIKSFKSHFNQENNKNIVFSASYGEGKSVFMEDFFRESEIKKDYEAIIISPINYVVSTNEQIFDLIKLDVFLRLILLGYYDEKKYLNSKLSDYKTKHGIKHVELIPYISSLISNLSIDPEVQLASTVLGTLYSAVEKIRSLIPEKNDDHVVQYFDNMIRTQNTYVENNFITEILHETIVGSEKKFVLVIDDMDRLDPDHLFRIFNIFSAQYSYSGEHKLGFNKVIFVCDINNIRNLYEHKNGSKSNFQSYFEKFYSIIPYYFNNRDTISGFILKKFKIEISSSLRQIMCLIVKHLYDNKKIGLRNLAALDNYQIRNKHIDKEFESIRINNEFVLLDNYKLDIFNWEWVIPLFGTYTDFLSSFLDKQNTNFHSLNSNRIISIFKDFGIFTILNETVLNQIKDEMSRLTKDYYRHGFIYNGDIVQLEGDLLISREDNKYYIDKFNITSIKKHNNFVCVKDLSFIFSDLINLGIKQGYINEV